jgi:tRNA A37 threonylcarbamoyladenosine modification protein TsaB
VLDAGRGEVYAGEYQVAGEAAQLLQERLLAKDEFLSAAKGLVVATPDETLAGMLRDGAVQVPLPDAQMIARLGWRKLQAGDTVTPEQLEANYIRRSDAELLSRSGPDRRNS